MTVKLKKMGPIPIYIGSEYYVFIMQKQSLNEDGSEKPNKWIGSNKYVGDWLDNKKHGFGIQYYTNGNKY